jgi:hypothetical protein
VTVPPRSSAVKGRVAHCGRSLYAAPRMDLATLDIDLVD